MITRTIFLIMLTFSTLQADPWGTDADLCERVTPCYSSIPEKCRTPIMGCMAEIMIGFHQDVISPCDGPRSHFLPSSSQYTLNAIRKYGFFKGVAMGCDRLMRENNEVWVYQTGFNCAGQKMKLDPVR